MSYTINIPIIKDATFLKNPCNTKEKVILVVVAEDIEKILYPELIYSGEIYSNEV